VREACGEGFGISRNCNPCEDLPTPLQPHLDLNVLELYTMPTLEVLLRTQRIVCAHTVSQHYLILLKLSTRGTSLLKAFKACIQSP